MAKAKVTGWKQKRPYIIQAPEKFDYQELGTTMASDSKFLPGRTLEVSLGELMSDRAKQHLLISFEVFEVAGDKAKTRFKKFAINQGYLKSKIRKGMDKIDYQTDLALTDAKVRVKVAALSTQHVTSPKKKDIISEIAKVLSRYKNVNLDEFAQQVLFGKIGTDIYSKIKKITPISRVEVLEIRKV